MVKNREAEIPTALRSLARGGSLCDHGFVKGQTVDSLGCITEGDLSGGGGNPTERPGHRSSRAGKKSAAELGAHSIVDLLGEELRQAEQRLADDHKKVLGLIDQLVEGQPDAAAKALLSLQLHAPAHQPVQPVTALPAWRTWEVAPPMLPPGQSRETSIASVPRPSMYPSMYPGATVPMPIADAPRMVMPGQVEDEADCFEDANIPSDAKRQDKFYLHDIYNKVRQKRRERPSAEHMVSVVAIKRLSRNDLFREELASQQLNKSDGCCGRVILNPNNILRSVWDIMSMLLVLYDMIMIPFGFFEPEETVGMALMNWVTRLFWTLDIPMSFISGFVTSDGTIEMRPKMIAKKYMKSWCILDFSVVGADWTEIVLGEAMEGMDMARMSKTTRIFRILRMIRLLRLAKVGEIVSLLAERLPSEKLVVFLDIMKLIVIMLGIGHLLACIWYLIGKELGPVDRANWNWLDKFEFTEEPLEYRYIMSLRWALSQFAGGMDEVTPVSLGEHVYAGIVYIAAFWSGTVFLSILTSHFTQLYILGNQQSQQLNVMRRYLRHNGISKGLVLRVTRNAQHTMKMRQRATPEAAVGLLELVSEPLRIELHYEMYYPMLGLHAFFADYMKACPFVVRKICHAAMSTNTYSRDDVIFHFGMAATQMLIIRSGLLTYSWSSNTSENLVEGRWLSEATLWTEWVHRGVLTAIEDSIVFAINAQSFQEIIGMFELSVFDPVDYAIKFVRALNDAPSEDLSDLPPPGFLQVRKKTARNSTSRIAQSFSDMPDLYEESSCSTEPNFVESLSEEPTAPGTAPRGVSSRISRLPTNLEGATTQSGKRLMPSTYGGKQDPGILQDRIARMPINEDFVRRMRLEDLVNEEEV